MATYEEARTAVLNELLAAAASGISHPAKALALLRLAEAYAWLSDVSQSHGSGASEAGT